MFSSLLKLLPNRYIIESSLFLVLHAYCMSIVSVRVSVIREIKIYDSTVAKTSLMQNCKFKFVHLYRQYVNLFNL